MIDMLMQPQQKQWRQVRATGATVSAALFLLKEIEDMAMKKLAVFGMIALTAAPAYAQPRPPATETPSVAKPTATAPAPKTVDGKSSEAQVDQRIVLMHKELKITPAQESAWSVFAQVMRDNVTSTDQAYKERRASIPSMSAPDNMRNFARIEQARSQGVQNLAASFQTLYDAMSDDQKKTADAMFSHYEDRGKGRRHSTK